MAQIDYLRKQSTVGHKVWEPSVPYQKTTVIGSVKYSAWITSSGRQLSLLPTDELTQVVNEEFLNYKNNLEKLVPSLQCFTILGK